MGHPFHAITLSLIESSKQSIAAIESKLKSDQDSMKKISILHKLKNTGSIFLFYKTVEVEEKSKDVIEYETEMQDENENINLDEEEMRPSEARGLEHFIKYLKRNKLICNVQEVEGEKTSYFGMYKRVGNILSDSCNANQVYLCHMIERKKYVL